jgi:aspartyl-tRNA(Asn)/glutamyl-tRNA(Gln) amidotransferase subunit A
MTTIAELRAAYLAGTTTPTEVVQAALATIKEKDGDIHAFLEVYEDAMQAAEVATAGYKNNVDVENRPLLGIPLAIKNNILIKGKIATGGSKILEHYTATYDATVIAKLKAAGAVFVGSTNMDEFGMGSSTENSAFGITRNPIDPRRVPGGSTGGGAAAVAMGAVPAAIGTDTGGSIRQPSSFCGLVGFKPTYGAVSRYGLMPMGSSLDQAGPLANTVADAEIIHAVIADTDPYDATTIAHDTYPALPPKETYTFGVPQKFLTEGLCSWHMSNHSRRQDTRLLILISHSLSKV